ncbi:MAG: glycosyltransferase family 39 protein [Bacteroidetes bacterium]|nr:glycosyltransferase family 39 protein [Bacteroidota bacterium]
MINSISEKVKEIVYYLQNNSKYLFIFCIALMIPAFFINLGLIDFFLHSDETTRTLVALEMYISHDFITPTINGLHYMNKPPLYNWILVLFANIGGFNEFMLRLPATLSLFALALTIYLFVKKEYGKRFAMINALMILTCGRVLFWESFFTVIDFTFSAAVYAGIMSVYYFYKRDRYLLMYIVSYAFAAVAFMLKGLPAIVFQGITLVVLLGYEKKIRSIFTVEHFIGIATFLLITGGYYMVYLIKNPDSTIFSVLLDESTKRTVLQNGIFHTIKAMLRFPVDMFYHYLPWSLFIVFLFRRGFWKAVNDDPFLKFNFWVFLANVLVYWTSPDVYPKYIMMLMPMLYTVCWYFAQKDIDNSDIKAKIMGRIVMVFMVVFLIGPFIFPCIRNIGFIDYYFFKAMFLFVASIVILYLFFKLKRQRIILTMAFLLLIRIAFDWFIWPIRYEKFINLKTEAITVAKITKDKDLYFYPGTKVDRGTSYYLSNEKKQIIRFKGGNFTSADFCIADSTSLNELSHKQSKFKNLYSFGTLPEGNKLYLIRFYP